MTERDAPAFTPIPGAPLPGYAEFMIRAVLTRFPSMLVASLGLPFIWYHVAAIVITAVLVFSGSDWAFFEATRGATFGWLVFGAGIGGFFMPILLPLSMYLWGEYRGDAWLMRSGATVFQAGAIAWLVSSTYKAFTGRFQPEFLSTYGVTDISREFHFGFLQHGIFWGWPSSHACVAVAGAVALTLLFPRNRALRIAAFAYAAFVALGAAVGFHWLSDVIAGCIIGYAVGVSSCATRR